MYEELGGRQKLDGGHLDHLFLLSPPSPPLPPSLKVAGSRCAEPHSVTSLLATQVSRLEPLAGCRTVSERIECDHHGRGLVWVGLPFSNRLTPVLSIIPHSLATTDCSCCYR
ncbi:hypothetical protein ElyMa_000707500 [Elysia marginata]|uniref:Uncharacterized protein n=1 Tax=Elysia marginata TaxID=1093978 RepID=A0AAV4GJK1_9GAST|nr:hypothetical protein ElyMa_000707500 [Elysia marginata]